MPDCDELEERVNNLEQKPTTLQFLNKISYPFGLKEFISPSRTWPFNAQAQKDRIEEIKASTHTQVNLIKKTKYNEEFLVTKSSAIRSGMELLKFSESSTLFVKPLLIYYGITQIYSGILGCFLNFSIRPHHGLRIRFDTSPWAVEIGEGFFKKLVLCMNFLASTTLFFDFYSDNPPNTFEFENLVNEESIPIDNKAFNIEKVIKMVLKYPLYDSPNKKFLIDFIHLFQFSALSRYNPKFWTGFLKGTTFMYKIMQKTFAELYSNVDWFVFKISRNFGLRQK